MVMVIAVSDSDKINVVSIIVIKQDELRDFYDVSVCRRNFHNIISFGALESNPQKIRL